MPIVGEAIVRVRVISDRLGNDIGDSVRRGFAGANRDIDNEGRSAGRRAGKAAAGGVDDAAPDLDRAGKRAGERVGNSMRNEVNRRQRPRLNNLFKGLGGDMGNQFNLGIGAARMGKGMISALVTAGPSVLSAVGALATSMATEIITALSAIGPGLAGAVGVGLAGVSTLALNFGLLFAAFKSGNKELDAAKTRLQDIGKALGAPVAAGMVAGLTKMLDLLEQAMPQLNDLLHQTGEAFGGVATKIGETIASSENMSRIKDILATNLTFVGNFGDGLSGLITSFLILFRAAKPFIDYIGEGIKKFGEWAASSLAVAEGNGKLAEFMQHMLDKFRELAGVIGDFGRGIYNVFKAASPVGADLMKSLGGIGERFVAWTSDEGNMARMTAFFEKAHTLTSKIFEIFGKMFTAGGRAFENMKIEPLLHGLDTLANVIGPAVADIFNQIQAGAGPNLAQIWDNIGMILTKIADSGIIQQVAQAFSALLLVISELLKTDIGSYVAGLALAWALFGGALGPVIGIVSRLGMALLGLSTPVLLVVAAVGIIVGVLATAYANSEKFRSAVNDLATAVGGKFMEIWDALGPKLEILWEKFQKLAGVIGDRLAPIIRFLTPLIVGLIDIIGTVINFVVTQVGLFFDFVANILSGEWAAAWDTFTTMVGNAFSFVGDIITKGRLLIGALLSGLATLIWSIFVAIWEGVSSTAVTWWNAIFDFFNTILTNIADGIRAFGNAIPPFLEMVWNWIRDTAVSWWNAIFDFFNTILTNIADGIRNFGNAIPPFLAMVWEWIRGAAVTAWNAIFQAVIQPVINLYNALVDWFTRADAWVRSVWQALPGIIRGIWDRIFDAVIQPVIDIYNGLVEWFTRADQWVRDVWGNITSALTGPIEEARRIIEGIIGGITSAIQGAIDFVGRLTSAITSVPDVPNPVGSGVAGGAAFGGISKLFTQNFYNHYDPPVALAGGGIVRATPGGIHALLGEGGRNERVEPLDASGMSNRDRMMIDQIVKSLTTTTEGGMTTVQVRIGDRELRDVITTVVTEHDRALARRARNSRRVA